MRILCNQPQTIDSEMLRQMEQAVVLCLEKDNLDPGKAEISLSFVSKEEIRRLNQLYRQIDRHTDVLSFPLIEDFNQLDDSREFLLGDVVICLEQAEQQAEEYGHSRKREILYLFVHSVCHLLGYDHMEEADKQEMREREEEVLSLLDLERN